MNDLYNSLTTMIKKMRTSTVMIFFVTLAFIITGFYSDRDYSFFQILQKKLDQYNRKYFTERTFMFTDRNVYRSGEDVWFQGYVSSLMGLPGDSVSSDLFVKLVNSKGEEIISRRYPLSADQASGRFLIPRTTIPGKYYLIAYSGWMRNQDPLNAFVKELLIGKNFDRKLQAEITYDRLTYYPGDSMHIHLRLIDPADRPLPVTEFDYIIGTFRKTQERGSGKTDGNGNCYLQCIVPEGVDPVILTVSLKRRRNLGDVSILLPISNSRPVITMEPENGRMVRGIENEVAIQSRNIYGMPMSIEGRIVDSRGRVIQNVKTGIHGLGTFEIIPSPDSCFFEVTRPSGFEKRLPLSGSVAYGFKLHWLGLAGDTSNFLLQASGMETDSAYYWVAVQHGQIIWKGNVPYRTGQPVSIPLTGQTQGFVQVSVFNHIQKLIAERCFYWPGKQTMQIKTDRGIYHTRDRVVVSLEYAGNNDRSDISMAVSLKQLTCFTGRMNTHFNLNGFPYDTLAGSFSSIITLLDPEVILSQFKPVDWEQVTTAASSPAYHKKDGISGIIMDKKDVSAQHAKVRLTHIPNFRFYETQSDENGHFQILFGSDIIDFNYLDIDAYDAMGKVNLQAKVDQKYSLHLLDHLIADAENMDRQKILNTVYYHDPDLIYSLRYGTRNNRKNERETRKRYNPKKYANYANVMDIIQDMKPCQVKNGLIVLSDTEQYVMPQNVQEGAIIVINGSLKGTQASILKQLLPSDITHISISTSLAEVHRYTPINFQGVIELTTIQSMYRYRQPAFQLGMDILNTGREFYSPDYSIESPTSTDNRKTLYWNPHISLIPHASITVGFYTSDIKGRFCIRVEGMDNRGNPVYGEATFVVE